MGNPLVNPFVSADLVIEQSPGGSDFPWVLFLILGIFYLAMFAFYVVVYVLHALGLHRMAKRRGIAHAWLAWIPVAETWILGSISDQYQSVVKNKRTNRRGTLLGLYLAMFVLLVIYLIFATVFMVTQNFLFLGGFLLTAFAILGVSIAMAVFMYMAYFDFYRSADPENAVLYLVLSIVVSVVNPFLVFVCGKKDGGMPARAEEAPVQQLPEAQPEEVPQPQPPEE